MNTVETITHCRLVMVSPQSDGMPAHVDNYRRRLLGIHGTTTARANASTQSAGSDAGAHGLVPFREGEEPARMKARGRPSGAVDTGRKIRSSVWLRARAPS